MRFSTRAIHVGQEPEEVTGATIPPIFISSTYTQEAPNVHKGYDYSRAVNPTRDNLEDCLASLEGGEACAAFSSGLAATTAVFQTLRPGDGVVAGHDLYGGTFRLLNKHFVPWGLEVVYADGGSLEDFDKAIGQLSRPRMMWLETPTNPLLEISDLEGLSNLAKKHNMAVAVDNTFATPCLQLPIALGADIVVHSTTKYLGGHSDVIGGAAITRTTEQMEQIRFLQFAAGAVPSPFDCYLVQRGLKTLSLRMERHCQNAQLIAEKLQEYPQIEEVLYPGLPSHPGHELAKKQMCGFGGIVSIKMKGDLDRTKGFCSSLKVFSLAESLGGVESLCNHPALMTHASIPKEIREQRGVGDTLVRLSVGVEDAEDLLEDIERALAASDR